MFTVSNHLAKIVSVTNVSEKHGKERVPALSIGTHGIGSTRATSCDSVSVQAAQTMCSCAASITSAAGAGADHIRKRLYFVANSLRAGRTRHQPIECIPIAAQAAFAESRNAAARLRALMAGDYSGLLPSDEPSIAVERCRARGYGNAINAQTRRSSSAPLAKQSRA